MDMKKLKATVWMNLTEGKENSVAPNKVEIAVFLIWRFFLIYKLKFF